MSKSIPDHLFGHHDLEYIEAAGGPIAPALEAIERAAEPERIPILDRSSGRVLAALVANRRHVVEIGTAYGYSTLWMALAQPAGGRIVTLDPDRSRTALARQWWREAHVPDEQITVVNRPALEAFAADLPELRGPFDLAFVDALKHEYGAYVEALLPRLAPGALVTADNVLWSGRVSGARSAEPEDRDTLALRAFNAAMLQDPRFQAVILPVGDGLLVATLRP
jgi:predicted O-methyltransferase YrrM